MANIKISELRPAGSELFQDPESFLNELGDGEMSFVLGGRGQYNHQYTRHKNNQRRGKLTKSEARQLARGLGKVYRRYSNYAQTFVNY